MLEEEKATVTYITGGVGGDDNTPFEEREQIPIKYDYFSGWAAENQMRRLLSKDIPKYVGLTVIGLNATEDQGLIWSSSINFNHKYSAGYFNPHKKQSTIDMIHGYFVNNQNQAIDLPLKRDKHQE